MSEKTNLDPHEAGYHHPDIPRRCAYHWACQKIADLSHYCEEHKTRMGCMHTELKGETAKNGYAACAACGLMVKYLESKAEFINRIKDEGEKIMVSTVYGHEAKWQQVVKLYEFWKENPEYSFDQAVLGLREKDMKKDIQAWAKENRK